VGGRVPHVIAHAHGCFSAAQIAKMSLLALHSCLTRQLPCLHARCNLQLPTFVFTVVWCLTRQADRNGETVKHFNNCIKVLSYFLTLYKSAETQQQAEARRCTWQCTDGILIISASNFCARELCRSIIASHVAIATCRKTCFLNSFYFNTRQNHIFLAFRI